MLQIGVKYLINSLHYYIGMIFTEICFFLLLKIRKHIVIIHINEVLSMSSFLKLYPPPNLKIPEIKFFFSIVKSLVIDW